MCVTLMRGTCDACDTGVCVEDTCAPTDCVPCDTEGGCPTLRLGTNGFSGGTPAMSPGTCAYDLGCLGFSVDAGGITILERRCSLAVGGLNGILESDCERDGIPLVAEGTGQACTQQSYVGPDGSEGTCNSTCAPGCVDFDPGTTAALPHGGSLCRGSPAGAYACGGVEDCPSTRGAPAMDCIETTGGARACIYFHTCGETDACFDFIGSSGTGSSWLTEAYDAGDCDGDGNPNSADSVPCGPPDAGLPPLDAAASDASMPMPEDASGADAASPVPLDAGHALLDAPRDAALLGPVSFQGSGCACRAQGTRPGAHLALLGALGLALGARTRRAARRRG
jgi:hypothetical protein